MEDTILSIYHVSESGAISLRVANVPFENLQWNRRLSACGDFSVELVGDMPVAWPGRYLLVRSNRKEVGLIEKVEYDEDESKSVIVSGRFAECLLDRRSFGPDGGSVAGANWRQAVTEAFSSWVMQDAPAIRNGTGTEQATGSSYAIRASSKDTAMEAVYAVTAAQSAYPVLEFDWEAGELVLTIIEGVDRTRDQSERPVMVFSLEMATAQATSYSGDYSVACSEVIAYTQSYAEGEEGIEETISVPGFDAETMWRASASEEVSSLCSDTPTSAEVTEAGRLRAYDHMPALAVDVDVLGSGYGTVWDLADTCEADIPQAGVSCSARVEEVREVEKKSGVTLSASLGSKELTKVARAMMRMR